MARLGPVDPQTLIRVFEAFGFVRARMRGSHQTLVRPGIARPLVIPLHGEIQPTINLANLRTARISRDEYLQKLSEL